jgi:Holliday junction resolvasome RuvABC endonuclease subunit
MAVDASSRSTGWAIGCDNADAIYGVWQLPGIADLGKLYAAYRCALEDAIAVHRPKLLVMAPALFSKSQTSARALLGLVAITDLVAFDEAVEMREIAEGTARKEILGRGSFGPRVGGKLVRGKSSVATKSAVMAWAEGRGWKPQTDDAADALVLLMYAQRWQTMRAQWGAAD